MAGDPRPRTARRLKHERRVLLLALVPAVPALLLAVIWLWNTPLSGATRVSIALVLGACWLGGAYAVRNEVVRPLQSLSNMVAALREGDYSMRASSASPEDALGLALLETSLLSAQLRSWRLGELEAAALLRTVMAEIDLGVFAFDEESRLRLVIAPARSCSGFPRPGSSGRARNRSDSIGRSTAKRHGSKTWRSLGRRPGDGGFGGRRSGKTVGRIRCSC